MLFYLKKIESTVRYYLVIPQIPFFFFFFFFEPVTVRPSQDMLIFDFCSIFPL